MGRRGHRRRAARRKCARSKPGGRLLRRFPTPAKPRPPLDVELAIEGIATLLRGQACDFADVALDMQRHARLQPAGLRAACAAIPRGETRTYGEIAARLGASGAMHSVAQAMARNPFVIIVPCHRVLEAGRLCRQLSAYGGSISKRRLLSIEGALAGPPARRCSTCCCRLRRRARSAKSAA